jgi:hypothetical protein
MLKAPFPFVVDNDDNPYQAEMAIRELRRMVRFGRMAERALEDLKTKGFCLRQIPCMTEGRDRNDDFRATVRVFQPKVIVTRANIPWYGEPLRVDTQRVINGEHGGLLFKEVEIVVHCPGIGYDENGRGGDYETWKPLHLRVGNARMKSNGQMTFVHDFHDWEPKKKITVHKLYAKPSSGNAISAYKMIAQTLAIHIIRFSVSDVNDKKVPYRVRALRENLPHWLIEDGFIQTFCKDVMDLANVAIVMKT